MSLRLADPLWLALGVPLVALLAYRLRALPAAHRGRTRRAIQACLLLAAVCVSLALARLEHGAPIDRMAVVFAIDRSRSVDLAVADGSGSAEWALASVARAVERMRPDDLAGVVVFGAEAATELVPSPRPDLGAFRASIPRDATDVAAGLRRALADLPSGHAGRIVLLSDGVETRGDALAAAHLAAARGVPVDVLPIERAPRPEIAIERVQLPRTAEPGEPFELRVVTRATHEADVRVRVMRYGLPIAEGTSRLRQGGDVLVLREVAREVGLHRYDVLLEPVDPAADASPENDEGSAFVRVVGASRALVLSERPQEATALAEAIRSAGLEVELGARADVPVDLGELASYDLLVLSDLNARALREEQMQAVRAYVREIGGGLAMFGVRDAFGLGGYAHTPVEEALPATFDLRRRRDRASLAMVIAIDRSGSMTVEVRPGVTKLDLANEAASRSAELLSPSDRVAVAHVDTAVAWTLPMTTVSDPHALGPIIRQARPGGGGIYVDLTLEASYAVLREQPTQLRHLLLFSDGSDSEQMHRARALVAEAARDRITTSIVSMGNGPDTPELEALSRLGGGRFYIVEDMTELPRIFTQETIAASRAAVVEEAFRARRGAPSAATEGIDFDAAPALEGYVVVQPRPRANVLLHARGDDPLLLEWQFGVGRSAVFASDAGARLTRPWLGWQGHARLFGQLARLLARAPERGDAEVHVGLRGGRGAIRVEAIGRDGRMQNDLDLVATIAAPGGRAIEVPLAQTGAGRYEADFDAGAPGAYLVTVRALFSDGSGALVGSAGIVRGRGDELRGEGTDHALLARIASISGGRLLGSLDRVFVERPPATHAYVPLWRPLLVAAMLLMLASVALRRLEIPWQALRRWMSRRARAHLERPLAQDDAARAAALSARDTGDASETGPRADGHAVPAAGATARPTASRSGQAAPSDHTTPSRQPGPSDSAARSEHGAPSEHEPPVPTPPTSLAENLLARRKKRR